MAEVFLISYPAPLISKTVKALTSGVFLQRIEMCYLSVMKSCTLQVQFTQNFHCFGRVITTTSWLTSLQERKFSYFIPQMLELFILVPHELLVGRRRLFRTSDCGLKVSGSEPDWNTGTHPNLCVHLVFTRSSSIFKLVYHFLDHC